MGEELEESQRFCLDPALEENYHKFLPTGCSHLLLEEGREGAAGLMDYVLEPINSTSGWLNTVFFRG